MRRPGAGSCLSLLGVVFFLASSGRAATITGTVHGPGGAPVRAAFVAARNAKTGISVMVLSNTQGQYHVTDLPAGKYELQVRAAGYDVEPKTGITLKNSQEASFDFNLQKAVVHWADIPIYQGFKLLPDGNGKQAFIRHCGASCHGFEKMIETPRDPRDKQGWVDVVEAMRKRIGGVNLRVTDADAADIASYMFATFGKGSTLAASPADLPNYEATLPRFSDDGLKIVYTMYEMPSSRMPWDANPDRDGDIWLPYFGMTNGVGKLDPRIGKLQEYKLPTQQPPRIGIHSVYRGPDGIVWFTEEEENTLGRLDPKTGHFTEFKNTAKKGSMNTVRVDSTGMVWISGNPYTRRFDPKTNQFTDVPEAERTYAVILDKAGNKWFTENSGKGRIYRIAAETEKLTEWMPPSPGQRRRIQLDSHGIVWFAEYAAGKIGRLDPTTGAIREYDLPGDIPTPYPVGIDQDDQVWYASGVMDRMGRLDPSTGKVTEYPAPAVGNGMRELNNDSQGRMWFTSPGNNTVGFLSLAK